MHTRKAQNFCPLSVREKKKNNRENNRERERERTFEEGREEEDQERSMREGSSPQLALLWFNPVSSLFFSFLFFSTISRQTNINQNRANQLGIELTLSLTGCLASSISFLTLFPSCSAFSNFFSLYDNGFFPRKENSFYSTNFTNSNSYSKTFLINYQMLQSYHIICFFIINPSSLRTRRSLFPGK